MPRKEQAPNIETGLAHVELITAELDGKMKAIAGYDEILWKIRAGYVGLLYGSLAIIIGTSGIQDLPAMINEPSRILTIFLLVAGFSLSSYFVDRTYLAKKVKVIAARNLLMRLTFNKAFETTNNLSVLLAISGELKELELPDQAREEFRRIFSENRRSELLPIYATAPFLLLCIYLIVYYA